MDKLDAEIWARVDDAREAISGFIANDPSCGNDAIVALSFMYLAVEISYHSGFIDKDTFMGQMEAFWDKRQKVMSECKDECN